MSRLSDLKNKKDRTPEEQAEMDRLQGEKGGRTNEPGSEQGEDGSVQHIPTGQA